MKLRKTWHNMINRCKDNFPGRKNYYDKGIRVCDRWMTFENFLSDMGEPPSTKMTVERIDGSKGYYPENCKWATQKEQANNTSSNHKVKVNDKYMNVSQLAESIGRKPNSVLWQIRRGWTINEIINGNRELPTKSIVKQNINEIIELKNKGWTYEQIGNKFGVDGSNISRELCKIGENIGAQTVEKRNRENKAAELRKQGFTLKQIANNLGVSVSSAYNYCNKTKQENEERKLNQ